MGCPNLPVKASEPDGPRGCLFITEAGHGAFQQTLDDPLSIHPIQVTKVTETKHANFCESVESGHVRLIDASLFF